MPLARFKEQWTSFRSQSRVSKWQQALVYLNDIVSFSKTPARHIDHIRSVRNPLRDAGVILKHKKCDFSISSVHSLRHTIRPGLSEVFFHTTDPICDENASTAVTELKCVLGFRNMI